MIVRKFVSAVLLTDSSVVIKEILNYNSSLFRLLRNESLCLSAFVAKKFATKALRHKGVFAKNDVPPNSNSGSFKATLSVAKKKGKRKNEKEKNKILSCLLSQLIYAEVFP